MPKRWCKDCRVLFDMDLTGTRRCPRCQSAVTKRRNARANTTSRGLGADHQRRAAALLATAQGCHWCGKPPAASDPLVADHLIPRSRGGTAGPQ
jgi:hypothetical protein